MIGVFIAAAAVVAATVTAAPQNAGNGYEAVISIAGQQCKCVPFYQCTSADNVNLPQGSSDPGCSDELICCRLPGGEAPVTESIGTNPSSEEQFGVNPIGTIDPYNIDPVSQVTDEPNNPSSESIDYTTNSTTREPYIDNQPNKDCTCVLKNQCSEYNKDDYPDIDIRLGCNYNQVCCPKDYIKSENNHGPPDESHTGNNDIRSCGIGMPPPVSENNDYLFTRVLTSEEKSKTYFGEFPWMVAVLKTFVDETTQKTLENVFQCGGSLVHPQVVLTAAHCVSGINYNLLKVRVGEWDTQSSDNKQEKKDSHEDLGVSKIFIHPDFKNGSLFNDVALIKLNSASKPQPHINTICIADEGKYLDYDSKLCISTGWGKNGFKSNHQYQEVLKKVELPLVPNDLCQHQLRKTRLGNYFRLHESFICAGGVKGVDACHGDGGGPLICPIKGESKKYVQVGIVAWGIGCGDEGVPGVYSSVMHNINWVNEHLKLMTH